MKTYIYKVESHSDKRGCNRFICVYRIKENMPSLVGEAHVNTAAYKGDCAVACNIISDVDGLKMADGYRLADKSVRLINI